MALLKDFSPFGAALFKTSDQGTTANDAQMGDHVRFNAGVGDGRSESRSLNPGERWFPVGKLRATHWRSRFGFDSEKFWAVCFQMKTEDDDVNRRTPTRCIDADRGQNGGRLVFIVRSSANEPHYTLMTPEEFVDCQGKVLDFLHVEFLSKGADGYSRMAWKYAGETQWRRDVVHRGPNLRDTASGTVGLTYTWGLYRGDTGDADFHDLGMRPGPRVYDTEAEAIAAAGIGAIDPPPPPDETDPCAAVKADAANLRTQLAQATSDLNAAREGRDLAITALNNLKTSISYVVNRF